MPYAVLQQSLDQVLDCNALADALQQTGSLTRYDSFRLHKELFGIVARDLELATAESLQRALAASGYPTDIVEDVSLQQLDDPIHPFAIRFEPTGLVVTDLYGNDALRSWSELVLAAGGHMQRLTRKQQQKLKWTERNTGEGVESVLTTETESAYEEREEFHLEFHFAVEPKRLQCLLNANTLLRVNGEVIRHRQRDKQHEILQFLAAALPETSINLGIRGARETEPFVYPSVAAFEEEIVWTQYRRSRQPR